MGKVFDSQVHPAICGVLTEADLNAQLERFWKTDEMTQPGKSLPTEQRCEAHFVSNTCRDIMGRFNVGIPFEGPLTTLGESRQIAVLGFRCRNDALNEIPCYIARTVISWTNAKNLRRKQRQAQSHI